VLDPRMWSTRTQTQTPECEVQEHKHDPGMWSTRTQIWPSEHEHDLRNKTPECVVQEHKHMPYVTLTPPPPPPKDEKKLMGFEPTTHLKVSSLNPKQNPRFYLKTNYFGQQNISI